MDYMVINPLKPEASKRFKAPVQGLPSKLMGRARIYNLYVNADSVSRKLVGIAVVINMLRLLDFLTDLNAICNGFKLL